MVSLFSLSEIVLCNNLILKFDKLCAILSTAEVAELNFYISYHLKQKYIFPTNIFYDYWDYEILAHFQRSRIAYIGRPVRVFHTILQLLSIVSRKWGIGSIMYIWITKMQGARVVLVSIMPNCFDVSLLKNAFSSKNLSSLYNKKIRSYATFNIIKKIPNSIFLC